LLGGLDIGITVVFVAAVFLVIEGRLARLGRLDMDSEHSGGDPELNEWNRIAKR
jgi:hypothetical protein